MTNAHRAPWVPAAGLAPGQGEALAEVDPDWLVNGRFGVVQFAGRR